MIKICKECGCEFETKSGRQQYCRNDHYRPCPVCGKLVLVKQNTFNDPPRCCSKDCQVRLTKKRNLDKYGIEDPGNSASAIEKRRKTNLERYGVADAGNRPEAMKRRKQTNLERYGVENAGASVQAIEKRKQTNLERYGVENAMQNAEIQKRSVQGFLDTYGVANPMQCDDIVEKAKQTNLRKYGVPWAIAAEEVQQKAAVTKLERYGTLHPTQVAEIQLKTQQTALCRYGVTHYSKTEAFKQAYQATLQERYGVSNSRNIEGVEEKIKATNLERYGVEYAFLSEESIQKSYQAMQKLKSTHVSNYNKTFGKLLDVSNISYKYEYPLERHWYDFILPDKNILIEIDPTYTHSIEPSVYYPEGIDKYYHRTKSQLAERNGFRCIHVFDWDDPAKIVYMLLSKHSIYARNCKVRLIDISKASEFLNLYHLHGSVRGQIICVGLIYDDNIVSVMTFGQPRYTDKYELELLRYATVPDLRIVGGASKMFKYMISNFSIHSIISYCDRAKFLGDVYGKLGFDLLRINPPSKFWSKGSDVITDTLLQAHGYVQLFGADAESNLSNEQFMHNNGWRSVYDCGQAVYVWSK